MSQTLHTLQLKNNDDIILFLIKKATENTRKKMTTIKKQKNKNWIRIGIVFIMCP